MKKVLFTLMCLAAMMATSMSLKAQEVTLTLTPGYTWISCPMTDTIDFATALGSFIPMENDIIKTQRGLAVYLNGRWRGSISQFFPGMGYMYKSNRTEPVMVTFNVPQPALQVLVTTSEPTNITTNSATSGGSITTDTYVFTKGICWATHANPTPMDDDHSENGGGDESFTAEMTELDQNTTYYVRAYAVTQNGIVYGNEVSFITVPIWTIEATPNPAEGGTITGAGDYEQNAVCTLTATPNEGYVFANWTENGEIVSTEATYTFTVDAARILMANFTLQSFTINVSASPSSGGSVSGGGSYNYGQNCTVSAVANTGYIFANWTENGEIVSTEATYTFTVDTARTVVANFTLQSYTINVSANPNNGGNVWGGGNYNYGQNCTVHAMAQTGYTFINWTVNGDVVSTNANYTFTVNANKTLVANFTLQSYIINVSASPSSGGSVSGSGSYNYGQNCTVSAIANSGYTFIAWTENGNLVSANSSYTFTVNNNCTLIAIFLVQSQAPTGAINGLFTINADGDQVYFSQGNLQYQASTNTWRFAESQYNYIGASNSSISQTYDGWIDLFGWGTSGYHNPNDSYNVNYQPWSTSNSIVNSNYNYYGYGPSSNMASPNLTGSSANYDWGVYNPISNGSNTVNQWRTLTIQEWQYVFNTRTTTSGIRYAKARVNYIKGIILLPDNWSDNIYSLSNTNSSSASYSSNTMTAFQWSVLEQAGAVFLPASGCRFKTTLDMVGSNGFYWSTSSSSIVGGGSAHPVSFGDSSLGLDSNNVRFQGFSVRLVQDVE